MTYNISQSAIISQLETVILYFGKQGQFSKIKFLMYKKKFIVTIKACVHYLYFCHQNKIFKKSSKMLFIVPRKLLLSSRLFKLLYFPLHLFFPFIAIADFTEEVNWNIIMSLNWILKTQISGEVKF